MRRFLRSLCKRIVICLSFLPTMQVLAYPAVKYLGIEQGLSNNAVTCIFKDHYGFIWIGTYDGLNRYDGEKFKIFRNIWGDNKSLNFNYIANLSEVDNKILIGTQKGLAYYSYTDSRFYPAYCAVAKNGPLQKITNSINALVTDKNGNAYIAADNAGVLVLKKKAAYCYRLNLAGSSATYDAQALTVDQDNQLWVFVKNRGLCRYNKNSRGIELVCSDIKYAACLLADGKGNIWIGTENGLYSYNVTSRKITPFNSTYHKLTNDNIMSLHADRTGLLWIATNGGGINIFDMHTGRLSYLVPGEKSGSLRSGAVSAIYEDDEGRKWIATLRGGINVIDPQNTPFQLFTHDPFNKNSVVNNFIISFCEDEHHNIWIGTDGGGISYWNTKTNQYTSYTHNTAKGSLSSNFVVSIVNDYQNQVWVATFSGGIDAFDRSSGQFKHYTCFNTVTENIDRNLWKLYEDSRHNLWAGSTRGGALYLYNRKTDKFELFDNRLTNIHAIYEDHSGNLWAGDYTRLINIDRVTKKHQYYPVNYAIRSFAEDKSGNLWIGTEGGGLLLFNKVTGVYKRYTERNGLPGNSILNILTDNSGNLWCSTYNGLSRFNTATGKFKNYDASDGLQSNQFNYNAALKLKDGRLMFGGINGFNLFDPADMALKTNKPQLRITGLRINNTVVEGGMPYTDNQPLVALKRIVVPYNQATIALDYNALEYSFPDKIKYAYYLEGWDHGWNEVGKLKTAYYTRLNEGTYTLHIRATTTSGGVNPYRIDLRIVVLPPWYRTWWAYFIYVSVIGSVGYSLWRYRIGQTRLKYEVEIANLKVEREKELNEKKLSFFTNVAHEFRTPLTLIINPIKDLLKADHNRDNTELTTIYRNSRRLLGLVDHLLLFRKTESENDTLNLSSVNFSTLCREVYLCFGQQARFKKLKYDFHCSNEAIMILADREKIEIAVFNLISNAVKFTPAEGEIQIKVEETAGTALLKVCDSGCGIAEGTGEKLFDKFYQIKDNTSLKTGFGIGLYLVKSFINHHNGSICYQNNENGGTIFTAELPKGKPVVYAGSIPEAAEKSQHLLEEFINDELAEPRPSEEEFNHLELMISDRQSVLIIDDNDQLRGYVKKIFKENFRTYEAGTCEKGLELIKKYLPDLVITDIMMEGLSGIELCQMIKQDASLSHIPVILLTGDPNPEMKLKGIEVGAVDFVSKPFEKEMLLARVQGILRDRRELQNYFYNEVTLKSNTRHISEHHKDFLYKCISLIENYLVDPDFDVKTIADELGMSYSSLFKKIKSISGQSVNGFVRYVRLRKAAEIMIHTNCNVNEAALKTGFNDIKYFRENFIKQFGIKPSEFIKKHRTAFNKTYLVEDSTFH
ncbi:response regulator [Mucilaginibacter sp. RS28]|uniref:histidine kinase n=1 Tax=Mucilaginibacter straminoryzae TaxID=2932774 RepID=A0A9X2B8X7_9SPHI|nr:hybrid sensor histidine kinase/response regulator transcription factor [Mucilaginibacter straminoryzae]MCJ8209130.1 response regulator [Mucilaginibacter straminoryzae]